jgi:hypothetical protein
MNNLKTNLRHLMKKFNTKSEVTAYGAGKGNTGQRMKKAAAIPDTEIVEQVHRSDWMMENVRELAALKHGESQFAVKFIKNIYLQPRDLLFS